MRVLLCVLCVGAAVLALAVAGTAGRTAAQGQAVVGIEPPSQTAAEGEQVQVEIAVENASNLGAYEVGISYDPEILEFVNREDSGFLGSTGRQVLCPDPVLGEGNVLFGCGSLNPLPRGPDGSGTLATVTFKAVGAGTSALTFTKVELADPDGDDCCGTVEVREAAVAVTGAGEPPSERLPPTPTPNPAALTPTVPAQAPTPSFPILPTPGAADLPYEGPSGGPGEAPAAPSSTRVPGSEGSDGEVPMGIVPPLTGETFPGAGSGPPPNDSSAWPTVTTLALAAAGVPLVWGALAYHRRRRGDGTLKEAE